MEHDFWVTIHGERGAEWEHILGTSRLPVRSPIPVLANLPGMPEPQHVYLVALDKLPVGALTKIIDHLSAKFDLDSAEAAEEIEKAGIPIWEKDCSLMVWNPQRWLETIELDIL